MASTQASTAPTGSMPADRELHARFEQAKDDVLDRLLARVAELEEKLYEKELKNAGGIEGASP